jgi:molecular chaperone DnaK (HSP70)
MLYNESGFQWGYQTGPFDEVIRGVKLLLDEEQSCAYAPASDSALLLKRKGKTPVEASGDYLRQLVSHAKTILKRRFGRAVECMELKYVVTVPAVWSDKAKDATLRAANRADIHSADIFLVSEPEAAALYTLRAIQPNSITVGLPST